MRLPQGRRKQNRRANGSDNGSSAPGPDCPNGRHSQGRDPSEYQHPRLIIRRLKTDLQYILKCCWHVVGSETGERIKFKPILRYVRYWHLPA